VNRVRKQIRCSENTQQTIVKEEITVAILDTGIGRHPDFGDRVIAFADFVNGRRERYDDSGHGTHVAGCVGGSGYASRGFYRGVAPACRFCIGKVLDQQGEGCIESMQQGLTWVLENQKRYQIRVLNVSLGIGKNGEMERMEELGMVADVSHLSEAGFYDVCR